MAKYTIQGLDCASCANEIECELKKAHGLEDARLSFRRGVLYIDESPGSTRAGDHRAYGAGVTITSPRSSPNRGNGHQACRR
jgi:copper chaperone CopZ